MYHSNLAKTSLLLEHRYALRFDEVEDATSFRSSLDSSSAPPTPPPVEDRFRRLTMNTTPSTSNTTATTSPSRRLTIDTPVHIQNQSFTEKEHVTTEESRHRGSSLIVPESPLIPPGVDLVKQEESKRRSLAALKKRSSVVSV